MAGREKLVQSLHQQPDQAGEDAGKSREHDAVRLVWRRLNSGTGISS